MRRRQVCAKLMNCPQCATFGLIGGTAVNVPWDGWPTGLPSRREGAAGKACARAGVVQNPPRSRRDFNERDRCTSWLLSS